MGAADQYVDTYRQEVEEHLVEIEQTVLDLEDDPGDREALNRLFRSMHTIKGSGAMFGFDEIAGFTHHVENALDRVRAGELELSPELINLVFGARDLIRAMLHATGPLGPAERLQRDQIVEALDKLAPGAGPAAPAAAKPAAAKPAAKAEAAVQAHWRIRYRPAPGAFTTGLDPAALLDELRRLGACTVTADLEDLPRLEKLDPERCYLRWDAVLSTDKGEDAVRDVFIFLDEKSQLQIEALEQRFPPGEEGGAPRLGDILVDRGDVTPEEISEALSHQKKLGELLVADGKVSETEIKAALTEQQALTAQQAVDRHKAAAATASVRVPSDKLDNLINLVGELVIVQARLTQLATTVDVQDMGQPIEEIERLTASLRDSVFNIRMLPIGTTFGKFRRLVRDLSAELGKEIDLELEGEKTELDKTVIERLDDPLVHLVRNCIDHGIESPDRRAAAGKPRRGTIRLEAAQRGAHVVIVITDDGGGLDREAILRRAVERGLLESGKEYADKEVFLQIFQPGFSTAAKVTSVSGRGVGMDVVKREIDALRGTVQIASERGRGTTITLALPLTLAIIDGLMVEVGADRYVVPLAYVEECVEYGRADQARTHGRHVIAVRGELVPFVRLREFFTAPGEIPAHEQIVIARLEELRVGIACDRIVGNYQTVIKSLGKSYKNAEGVSGATILGDGTVALIVDVPALVQGTEREELTAEAAGTAAAAAAVAAAQS